MNHSINKPDKIHFVGIGGSGMSGLAEVLLNLGYSVSGSDLEESFITQRLSSLGAKVYIGHKKSNVTDKDMLIISSAISKENEEILEANKKDYGIAKANGMPESMLDRLLLDQGRLQTIAKDLSNIIHLDDPIGETIETRHMDNGLSLEKRRVPLGVIASIYESRPNVTVDISALCVKSGNTCLMRGGSESINSNLALVDTCLLYTSDAADE